MPDNKYGLSTQEQIRLVNGGSFFGTAAIPEKDIPSLQFLDGGTGMNFEQLFGDMLSREGLGGIGGKPLRAVLEHYYEPEKLPDEESKELHKWITDKLKERFPDMIAPGCYPPGILLGATWDKETVYETGKALGMEARAYGVHVLLGTPNVNMHRDIRNGRLFEGYSEDPCLVCGLAPELVKGVQEYGVAANVKHFAANHQETNRLNVNEHIPERALQELYYPGFRACVDAGVATVMSAYNQINGVPCTENRVLLHDMLREDWGFDGLVMSDWGAVYHPAAAVNAGNDLAMPGPIAPDVLTEAYNNGTLIPERLAFSAERAADLAKKYCYNGGGTFSAEETDKIAYNAAAEGIILLKNDRNVLPLEETAKIALYCENNGNLLTCGEGSAGINTDRNVSFYTALSDRFGKVSTEIYDDCDTLVYVYKLPGQEGNDRADIGLREAVVNEWKSLLPEAEKRGMKKILVLNVSGPVALGAWESRFDAVICTFLPGMQGAAALADIISGKVNPSGRLPLTFPKRIEDMPTFLNFPGDGMQVHYGEGIFIGYRWYDTRRIEPLYPFGFGLSYTEFAIEKLTADCENFNNCVTVTAEVVNKGSRGGKTVVQIYVSDRESTLTKPVRELKAFAKLYLEPNERKTVSFTLNRHDFESYDPNLHEWTLEEGFYDISAGLSSRDIQAECTVYAQVKSPYFYGAGTSVKIIMENPQLKDVLYSFFNEMNLQWTAILSSYEYTAQDTIEKILDQEKCPVEAREKLYAQLGAVRKV
ncbi:MAG: hypothetical protein E7497_01155 [Ruminococcus sp.]|nr:hypothetical protein [Ruminococcus sp.]